MDSSEVIPPLPTYDDSAGIFVSTLGNDATGDGSIGNPFRTIAHALTVAVSGDQIILRGTPTLAAPANHYQEAVRIRNPNMTIRSKSDEWAVIECPVDNDSIGVCVDFDVDSSGGKLQHVEVVGGYYYGIKLETMWDWGGVDRSGASQILIEDVKVHDTGRDAIKITPQCDDVTIRRSEIYNTGVGPSNLPANGGPNAEGIDNVNGDRMIVQDSYVHDTSTTGIYFKGGATDCVVERTRIEHTGSGGIMVGFDTSVDFFDLVANPDYYESISGLVRNNVIIDTQYAGIGLYAAKDARVLNNTIINTAQAGHSPIYFGITCQDWDPVAGRPPSLNPVIRNNLVQQGAALPQECVYIRHSNDLGGLDGLSGMPVMDHNLYFHEGSDCLFTDRRPVSELGTGTFAQWQVHINGDAQSLTSDPLLTADGHLGAGSPAIDAGAALADVGYDIDGDARGATAYDIGGDEWHP
jgi:hypothetical protein